MIIVFIKNKLISIDTIMPLLLEMKTLHNVSSRIVISQPLAYRLIGESVVLQDVINQTGKIIYLGKGVDRGLLRKLIIIFQLFAILVHGVLGAKFIHFSAFNFWPLKIFGIIFNKNTFFSYGGIYIHKLEHVCNILRKNNKILDPIGENIIVYNNDAYNSYKDTNKNIFFFGETRSRKVWRDYVKDNSDRYFESLNVEINRKKGYIVYVLGPVIHANTFNIDKTSISDGFKRTLKILTSVLGGYKVLVKPHPSESDCDSINWIQSQLDEYDEVFVLTSLHPTLLAIDAVLFISNSFSTVLGDAYRMGVPVIEFSNYNDKALSIIKENNSQNYLVDHFIDNNEDELAKVLSKYKGGKIRKHYTKDINTDSSGLILRLNN